MAFFYTSTYDKVLSYPPSARLPALLRYLNPANYLRRLRRWWYEAHYDLAVMREIEESKFVRAGLSREAALADLKAHLQGMGIGDYTTGDGMASVHWLLFAALARTREFSRILEIGTFDGQTTALLARLFPRSEIVTVDLLPTDPILTATYARDTPEIAEGYERRLAANTAAPNVHALRVNSFFLPSVLDGTFDLVWVDGGHLYPEVAWDLCTAWNRLNPGGLLMCDDVIPNQRGINDGCVSPDSWEVMQYISSLTREPCWYFLKREDPEWSADPRLRKFVAMLVKETGATNRGG